MRWLSSLSVAACTIWLASLLSGCAMQQVSVSAVQGVPLSGIVHGGVNPVTGATIQLYAAGTGGYGTASTPLISSTVTTNSRGGFVISSLYTCPSASTPVYLTATGGNPGLGAGGNNPALALMAALGPCGNLSASTQVFINEVTTVAAVWSLAPFMTGYDHVATSAWNTNGLAAGFTNAVLVASTVTGQATQSFTYNSQSSTTEAIYPQYEINSLADALVSCVNSNGGTGAAQPCGLLFTAATPSGSAAPSNTIGAALSIALHPGSNVASIYSLITGSSSYTPTLAAVPNDWTVPILYQYYGKFFADSAMDANGVPWQLLEYYTSTLTRPAYLGSTYDFQGYSGHALAFDTAGKAYALISNYNNQSLTQLSILNSTGTQSGVYTDNTLANSVSLTFDSNGLLWAGGSAGTFIKTSADVAVASSATVSSIPMAADASGNIWSYATSLNKQTLSSGAIATANYTGGNVSLPEGIAVDHSGSIWLLNSNSTLSKFDPSGNAITSTAGYSGGGLSTTSGGFRSNFIRPLVIDGDGNVWAASFGNNTISEFSNSGAPLSPSTGLGAYVAANNAATNDLRVAYQPLSVNIDPTGDVWIIGNAQNQSAAPYYIVASELLGAGAPTVSPLATAAATNTIGVRP